MDPNTRRRHHFLPRFYLKGFCDDNNPNFLWMYTKGKHHNPGKQNYTIFNPCLTSTRVAGSEIDFYSTKFTNDKVDFDTVEKELEQLEKPSQPIIEKIRNRVLINESEKAELSRYIMLIFKRVRHFRSDPYQRINDVIKETIDAYSTPEQIAKLALHYNVSFEAIKEELPILSKKFSQPEYYKRMYNELLFLPFDKMELGLQEMRWVFAHANINYPFITSDNPVFFSREAGLKRSDLTFPISKDIALVATWNKDAPFNFIDAPKEIIDAINLRTVKHSTEYLYASINEQRITELANSDRNINA